MSDQPNITHDQAVRDLNDLARRHGEMAADLARVTAERDEAVAKLRTCETCDGSGVMDAVTGYDPVRDTEITVPETCAECSGTGVSSWGQAIARAESAERERDEYAAHVETLQRRLVTIGGLAAVAWDTVDCGNVEQHPGLPEVAAVENAVDAALAATTAASLAEHDAALFTCHAQFLREMYPQTLENAIRATENRAAAIRSGKIDRDVSGKEKNDE